MDQRIIDNTVDAVKIIANPYGYLFSKFVEKIAPAKTESSDTQLSEMESLRLESEKQEFQMRILEAQAKVAQELAIARRIETAQEVEMEEFFDYSGEGNAGANLDEKGISLGVKGSGRRVSKRIIRFKGGTLGDADLA